MKKSFMTRVLATGLSLAMAFSLSAATNVSVASAAAKPAMKSKTMTVKVGQKKNYQATAATQKAYKITKVKMSAAGKTKAKVTVNSSKKSIKVEGLAATKGSNVVISFKNNKTKKTTTVTTKVVVKEADEKLTMTAAATKVKEITVTFNKAVDTTTTKLVVKKGSAAPTIASTTFASDAKSAVIAMGTKLNEGIYTVEATVGEETLKADITVADEKLTTYELVGKNLVASAESTTVATISYKALNQYGEMMVADEPTVSCTFGTTETTKCALASVTAPSADKSGTITVADINTALAIPGQTGTIVIVDNKNGANLQETITYQSKAHAASATVYGIYNKKTEKLIEGNLSTGAKIEDYAILMSVKNQYDGAMTPKAIEDSKVKVTFTAAPVLTDLKLGVDDMDDNTKFTEKTYDGVDAFLVPLANKSGAEKYIKAAGTLSLTIVSGGKGVIASPSFTIDEAKMIKSVSVTPETTLFAGKDNKMIVEAYDADGNAITKYDDLVAANFSVTSTAGTIEKKKNADGTMTLTFNPDQLGGWNGNDNLKESTITSLMIYANKTTSGNYIVKPLNVTYYENPYTVAVAGKTDKTITACAVSNSLKLDLKTLVYEDQYGYQVKVGDKPALPATKQVSIYISKNDVFNGASAKLVSDQVVGNELVLHADQKGDATLYFRYGKEASDTKYDFKLPISATKVDDMVASDLKLVVNKGNAINASSEVKIAKWDVAEVLPDAQIHKVDGSTAYVYVTGVVNGKTVVVPSSQYTVVTDKIDKLGKYNAKDNAKTETKTITVVVDSASGAQTLTADVTVSNLNSAITTLKESAEGRVNVYKGASATAVTAPSLIKAVKIYDQYGNTMNQDDNAKNFIYEVKQTGQIIKESEDALNANELKIKHPSTQDIEVTMPKTGKYNADLVITTKDGKVTFTKEIELEATS